jgi:putative ubiquitin-RnfH superfamily antitoxin RatB of RatAB toxin-antitoxin module
MEIEIAHAEPNKQTILKLSVAQGATIEQAIVQSNILKIAEIVTPIAELNVGIFGKLRDLQSVVHKGDRIEIYRSLHVDPKTARHNRVKDQRKAKRQAIALANQKKKQQ